ncbi:hypothetical protein LCGC14_1654370, partial [marine sediment metagenome]
EYYDIQPENFPTPDRLGYDWDAFFAAQEKKLKQMPTDLASAIRKGTVFENPRVRANEKRLAQAKDDLKPWFDSPKYKGLTVEESDAVDALSDMVSEVVSLVLLGGQRISRQKVLKFMLQAGLGDKKIVSVAFVLTSRDLAPMMKNDFRTKWAMTHPDLVTFYPFIFDSMSEEEQMEWLERHGIRGSAGLSFEQ